MKKIVAVLSVGLLLLLAGCSGSTAPGAQKPAAQKKKPKAMVIVSGNPGGSVYYVGSGQAQILTANMKDITYTTEASSSAPIQNMPFVADDETASTMSILTLDGFVAGEKGDAKFGFNPKAPLKNVRFIQAGHTTTLYCVALKGNGIKTIADLKGRKISVPTIGNSANFQAMGIMAEYGVTAENTTMVPMLYAEAGDALRDETLEAIWINGGIPMAAITDLDTSKDIEFIDVGLETATKLSKANPFWCMKTLKAGTYKNLTRDITLMGVYCTLVVREDLEDDVAYRMTRILNENTAQLAKIHPEGNYWNIEESKRVMDLNIIPTHPGAQKYYDEAAKK